MIRSNRSSVQAGSLSFQPSSTSVPRRSMVKFTGMCQMRPYPGNSALATKPTGKLKSCAARFRGVLGRVGRQQRQLGAARTAPGGPKREDHHPAKERLGGDAFAIKRYEGGWRCRAPDMQRIGERRRPPRVEAGDTDPDRAGEHSTTRERVASPARRHNSCRPWRSNAETIDSHSDCCKRETAARCTHGANGRLAP